MAIAVITAATSEDAFNIARERRLPYLFGVLNAQRTFGVPSFQFNQDDGFTICFGCDSPIIVQCRHARILQRKTARSRYIALQPVGILSERYETLAAGGAPQRRLWREKAEGDECGFLFNGSFRSRGQNYREEQSKSNRRDTETRRVGGSSCHASPTYRF